MKTYVKIIGMDDEGIVVGEFILRVRVGSHQGITPKNAKRRLRKLTATIFLKERIEYGHTN